MTYSLSFSESFYSGDDLDGVKPSDRPTSVYQAILSIQYGQWNRMAHDVFGVNPECLDPLTVLDRIRQTNTCGNLDSPVRVWIDPKGEYDVLVYDQSASE